MREFIIAISFDKTWADLGLTDDDLRLFQEFLIDNPNAGKAIKGTGGLRKVRWALPNKGKSGGIRVLYVNFISFGKTVLVDCYGKGAKDNISENEKAAYKDFVKSIEKECRG